jgi:hypothetical protein
VLCYLSFWLRQLDHGFVKSVEAHDRLLSKKHLLQASFEVTMQALKEQFKATSIA